MGKRITIDLDHVEAAMMDDLRCDLERADPGAGWRDDSLLKEILISIIEAHLRLVAERGPMH